MAYLTGEPRQGRLGIGWAQLSAARDVPAADVPSLEIHDVDTSFARIVATSGTGSAAARTRLLRDLLGRATADEQDFLLRLLSGELRQGALEGVLLEAIARASGIAAGRVRRATMLAGDIGVVARTAIVEGDEALSRFILQPFKPVQPMLADSAVGCRRGSRRISARRRSSTSSMARASRRTRSATRCASSREIFATSRSRFPRSSTVVRAMPARELVLDGEAIVLRPDGTPQPFQITMRRFGRKLDVDRLKETLPITPFFFDALYVDGDALVDEPLTAAHRDAERASRPGESSFRGS